VSASPFQRFAVSVLDHLAAREGWRPLPQPRPSSGGWRRSYDRGAALPALAAVGPDAGAWASLGVEIVVPRERLGRGLADLVSALAPYEVAVDPDAGADAASPDACVRVALRVFPEGLTAEVFREAAATVTEAAGEARRSLAVPAGDARS
jgi:hypothetical protein